MADPSTLPRKVFAALAKMAATGELALRPKTVHCCGELATVLGGRTDAHGNPVELLVRLEDGSHREIPAVDNPKLKQQWINIGTTSMYIHTTPLSGTHTAKEIEYIRHALSLALGDLHNPFVYNEYAELTLLPKCIAHINAAQ